MRIPSPVRARPSNGPRSFVFGAIVGACMIHASTAAADTTSWLSVGGGYGFQHSESRDTFDGAAALSAAIGVGTDPLKAVVVGGVIRSTTYFSLGTDLAFGARVTTGGFSRGQWGLSLEIGPGWRSWGHGDFGRVPLEGAVLLGGPWGLQVGLGGQILNLFTDDPKAIGAVALFEIDLLRLTVMRQGMTDRWWENPSPAGGPMPRSTQ